MVCLGSCASRTTPEAGATPAQGGEETGTDQLASARAFVERLLALHRDFDPALVHAYADDAVIATRRVADDGTSERVEVTGREWKALLERAMPVAAQRGDTFELRGLDFVRGEGDEIEVRAVRYSHLRCYEDRDYRLRLRPGGSLGYQIVREETRTLAGSRCDDIDPVALARQYAARAEGSLPMMLDEETRLDAVQNEGPTIRYVFSLVTVSSEELPGLEPSLRELVLAQVCSRPDFRRLVDHGGTVAYAYRSMDGQQSVEDITVGRGDCPGGP